MGETVWCALGPEKTGCGTYFFENPCPFMNAHAQSLRALTGCKQPVLHNIKGAISRTCIVVGQVLPPADANVQF